MKTLAGLSILLAATVAAQTVHSAQVAPKEAWQWTDEERLSSRFNPTAIAQRNAARHADSIPGTTTAASIKSTGSTSLEYFIDGRRDPALFMPHELFENLLRAVGSDASVRARGRRVLDPGLKSLGFNDTASFWADLEKDSKPFLVLQAQLIAHDPHFSDRELCAARAAALARVRKRVGSARFDQLLYTLIAPGLQYSQATSFPDPAARLRHEAEGCK